MASEEHHETFESTGELQARVCVCHIWKCCLILAAWLAMGRVWMALVHGNRGVLCWGVRARAAFGWPPRCPSFPLALLLCEQSCEGEEEMRGAFYARAAGQATGAGCRKEEEQQLLLLACCAAALLLCSVVLPHSVSPLPHRSPPRTQHHRRRCLADLPPAGRYHPQERLHGRQGPPLQGERLTALKEPPDRKSRLARLLPSLPSTTPRHIGRILTQPSPPAPLAYTTTYRSSTCRPRRRASTVTPSATSSASTSSPARSTRR